jgi:hypothetical protein
VRNQQRTLSVLCLVLVCAVFATDVAVGHAADGPPALPGPPPGAGTGFPLPPPPAQAPSSEPLGPPANIPFAPSGPGLLSGTAGLSGRRVQVRIACQTGGRAVLTLPGVATGTVAPTRYKCAGGRSAVSFSLSKGVASQIARNGSVLAELALKQGGATERLSVMVGPRPPAPQFWTSVFGLECNSPGSGQANLLAPNFTVSPTTTIDVRPWLAWYTPSTGWQWLGPQGPDASRWYRWTGTPNGVAEWHTPSGTINPWTWGPVTVSPGHGTYVVAVLEAIYWYSSPVYVWRYAHSYPASTYCAFS